ncbi:MAG: glycosyltransferase [Pseudomonadales bacterium]|nr:glycosyltransferase [Pseudomonadales bacterium]
MRILMISDVYFPRINGVSTSIQTFKQEFEKLGHEVILVAPDYPQDYPVDNSIIRIHSRAVMFDPEDRMMHYRAILKELPTLETYDFDLVHIHTPFVAHYAGVKVAEELGIPCIVTYHTLFEEYLHHYIPFLPRRFLKAFARRFSRSQCNQVDAIVAPSSVIVELLEEYGVQKPISVIPTGIYTANFSNGDGSKFRQEYGITEDKKLLLNVGRVAHEKNLGLLLLMFKQLLEKVPEACLVIAGEGPARETCRQQAAQLGITKGVHFVGYLDRSSQLVDCYHSADLFVFSSMTETQGLVLLEAIAANTPVVSIAAMGTRDILNDCSAAKIAPNDAGVFSETVADLLNNSQEMAELQRNCPEVSRAWDATTMATKMLVFYERNLNPPAGDQQALQNIEEVF